jgi:hypothetical protein
MVPEAPSRSEKRFQLTLDTWAVILALGLALIVRLNLFQKIPW